MCVIPFADIDGQILAFFYTLIPIFTGNKDTLYSKLVYFTKIKVFFLKDWLFVGLKLILEGDFS